MRDFYELGWQLLSVLWLCPEDKTKRYEDKTPIDGVATGKKDMILICKITPEKIILNKFN